MTTNLSAKTVTFTDDGYCTLFAMTDHPDKPEYFVMLSMTNEPDSQDIELGMAGVHIDLGAWSVEGYDLVSHIAVVSDGIVVTMTEEAVMEAGIDRVVEVKLEDRTIGGVSLGDIVNQFNKRLDL